MKFLRKPNNNVCFALSNLPSLVIQSDGGKIALYRMTDQKYIMFSRDKVTLPRHFDVCFSETGW